MKLTPETEGMITELLTEADTVKAQFGIESDFVFVQALNLDSLFSNMEAMFALLRMIAASEGTAS